MSKSRQSRRTGPFADIAGVIFDLDGTLADTLADIAAGVNHALASEGLPQASLEQIRAWVGEGYLVLMQRAAPQAGSEQLQRLVETGGSYYRQHSLDQTRLYPGVSELLEALRKAAVPLAVLSNKPAPVTGPIVAALCPGVCFAAVVGYRDEATKKPNPALALEIARSMGAEPSKVLFVGDSATDIETARNGGMPVVAVTWGFRSREQLRAAGPDAMIDRPAELLGLLGLAGSTAA